MRAKVNVPEIGVGFRGRFDAAPLAALLADTDYRAVRGDVLPDCKREQFADSDSRSGQKSGDHPVMERSHLERMDSTLPAPRSDGAVPAGKPLAGRCMPNPTPEERLASLCRLSPKR